MYARRIATHILLTLMLSLATASAAPVPPPPTELTTEMIVGTWDYQYGSWEDGWITFGANGWYISQHQPPDGAYYAGQWWCRGDTITLIEGLMQTRYEFQMRLRVWPVLTGLSGITPVGLWGRKPPPT